MGRADRRRTPLLRFVEPEAVAGRRHVVIDGAPRPATAATVSHWPGTPTPPAIRADLSAQSALLALATPRVLPRGVAIATVDHLDEDGMVATALLCQDGLAERHGTMLVESARVGDFGVVTDLQAAYLAFALAALIDPVRTPMDLGGAPLAVVGRRATMILDLVASMADDIIRFRDLWEPEAAAYHASVSALANGLVTITEDAAVDLAIVRPAAGAWPPGTSWAGHPVHPAAVHSASSMLRVATIGPDGCQMRFRYETWVRLASYRPRPRVDLSACAAELDRLEGGRCGQPGSSWVFDGVAALTPALHRVGSDRSCIDGDSFLDCLCRHLRRLDQAPSTWDPYR